METPSAANPMRMAMSLVYTLRYDYTMAIHLLPFGCSDSKKTSKTVGGKFTLGEYPALDLTGARAKALQLKSQLLIGVTPNLDIGHVKQTAVFTLQSASDLWFSHAEKINHYKKACYAYKEKNNASTPM